MQEEKEEKEDPLIYHTSGGKWEVKQIIVHLIT